MVWIGSGVTLVLGVVLLLFGVADLAIPRALFINATPAAGTTVAEVPSSVVLTFSNPLAPESTMDVTSTVRLLPSGEVEYLDGRSVVMKSGINPADAGGKSMHADLRPGLHKGLYWVSWNTTSAGWRGRAYGKTFFTVGMPVPEHTSDYLDGSFSERTYQWRSRRGALIGGIIMIALALYLWRRKRSALVA